MVVRCGNQPKRPLIDRPPARAVGRVLGSSMMMSASSTARRGVPPTLATTPGRPLAADSSCALRHSRLLLVILIIDRSKTGRCHQRMTINDATVSRQHHVVVDHGDLARLRDPPGGQRLARGAKAADARCAGPRVVPAQRRSYEGRCGRPHASLRQRSHRRRFDKSLTTTPVGLHGRRRHAADDSPNTICGAPAELSW